MAGGENTSGLFLCPVLGGRYALGGVHSKISMTPFKFADYQEFERRKGYDESIHLDFSSLSVYVTVGCSHSPPYYLKQHKCCDL